VLGRRRSGRVRGWGGSSSVHDGPLLSDERAPERRLNCDGDRSARSARRFGGPALPDHPWRSPRTGRKWRRGSVLGFKKARLKKHSGGGPGRQRHHDRQGRLTRPEHYLRGKEARRCRDERVDGRGAEGYLIRGFRFSATGPLGGRGRFLGRTVMLRRSIQEVGAYFFAARRGSWPDCKDIAMTSTG